MSGYAARRHFQPTNSKSQWNKNMIRAYHFPDIFQLVIFYNDDCNSGDFVSVGRHKVLTWLVEEEW